MWTTPMYDTSNLTVELREIVDSGVDIWDFDYPSYYEGTQRMEFEQKVIDHYYTRQIGQETVGRWLHMFRTRIREIMPYYIQLYKSQALMDSIEDPFGNVDITETFEQTTTGKSSSEGSGTTTDSSEGSGTTHSNQTDNVDKLHKLLVTPQGSVDNLEGYLTEATTDKDKMTATLESSTTTTNSSEGTTATTNSSESEGTVKHTFTKKGNQGVNTYAHDMKELRETFLNIDLQIINELKDLFLQVY
ncbi:MAG: hypothetical protein UIM53_05715 [Acutalibacteraceae bacterium]|nr:hypothetical protein [Acutalibacteraceae bacterium]